MAPASWAWRRLSAGAVAAAAHGAHADGDALARAELAQRPDVAGSAPAGSGSRPRSASRPGIDEGTRPRACAAASRRARRPRATAARLLAGRHRAGVDEDVAAVEIAARGARAGLGDVERAVVERLEQRADQVLGGQALDVLGVAQRQGGLVGDGLQQLLVLGGEGAHARAHGDEGADLLAIVAQRRPRLDVRIGERARRVEGDELERAVLAVAQPQLRGVAAQQPAHARGDHAVELLAAPDRDDALAQLGEVREGVDAQPRLLVEARVLDRARHERRGVDEEVEHALVELARGHRVQDDDARAPRPSARASGRRPSTGSAPPRARARTSCAGPRARPRG